jgi:hypothetical protein
MIYTYTQCKKYFINLQLYIGHVKKLKLHLHGPMYFVGIV